MKPRACARERLLQATGFGKPPCLHAPRAKAPFINVKAGKDAAAPRAGTCFLNPLILISANCQGIMPRRESGAADLIKIGFPMLLPSRRRGSSAAARKFTRRGRHPQFRGLRIGCARGAPRLSDFPRKSCKYPLCPMGGRQTNQTPCSLLTRQSGRCCRALW